ncbi:hypothetical protein NDU88_007477 [Pleurodeles waltl]|uniref:Uncharacterized protein n=1 Tax=Pleurodeles waltl TaxID=8319 RepID=A0AAV7NV28_PLEWA|nr:hypothetical protein NDU88_007477 [Pleurodeles waltl]
MISDSHLGDELRKVAAARRGWLHRGRTRASQPLLDRVRRISGAGEPQAPEGDVRSFLRNRGEQRTRSRPAARRTGEPAMPRGKATDKSLGKPARQLLFSEALRQQKHPQAEDTLLHPHITGNMAEGTQGASMDRMLQEISAVGRKLEGIDSAMVALTAETRSMRLRIADFQSQISRLD